MQEFNRESNTLGSKSINAEVTQSAVELKVLIEQMREQIQNIGVIPIDAQTMRSVQFGSVVVQGSSHPAPPNGATDPSNLFDQASMHSPNIKIQCPITTAKHF